MIEVSWTGTGGSAPFADLSSLGRDYLSSLFLMHGCASLPRASSWGSVLYIPQTCVDAQFCRDVSPASESCRLTRTDRHGSLGVAHVVRVLLCRVLIEAYYDLWAWEGFIYDNVQRLSQGDSRLGVALEQMLGSRAVCRGF